jgi:hypothetical protein
MLVMFSRMQPMAMSDLGVMGSLLMRARFMVLCGFAVVLGRFIMVMRGFLVMLVNVVVGHLNLPVLEGSTVAVRHDILMTPCEAERPQSGTYRLSRPVAQVLPFFATAAPARFFRMLELRDVTVARILRLCGRAFRLG